MSALMKLLDASRDDLIDGFPARAAISAMGAQDPLAKLNALLEPKQISVSLTPMLPLPPSMLNIKPHPVARRMLKLGVISSKYSQGLIEVVLNPRFFNPTISTTVIKALTFQSVCAHQLLHRARQHHSCEVYYKPLAESVNDEQELEAIAVGLVHDMKCKHLLSLTGTEQLQELSPRLAVIMANSRSFEPGSILKLQEFIKKLF